MNIYTHWQSIDPFLCSLTVLHSASVGSCSSGDRVHINSVTLQPSTCHTSLQSDRTKIAGSHVRKSNLKLNPAHSYMSEISSYFKGTWGIIEEKADFPVQLWWFTLWHCAAHSMLQHVTLLLLHLNNLYQHVKSQQHFRNHLHYKEERWGLLFLLCLSVSLHFHFLHGWQHKAQRMSEIPYRIFWIACVCAAQEAFSKAKRAAWSIIMLMLYVRRCNEQTAQRLWRQSD